MPRPGPHAMLAETTHDEATRMGREFVAARLGREPTGVARLTPIWCEQHRDGRVLTQEQGSAISVTKEWRVPGRPSVVADPAGTGGPIGIAR